MGNGPFFLTTKGSRCCPTCTCDTTSFHEMIWEQPLKDPFLYWELGHRVAEPLVESDPRWTE